ncbi:single-stranded DNA-binding protein [Geodermatophilus sp. SYSU D00710]
MSATEITVTGNVVTSPSRVRTPNGSVTNFRVASTERRYDSTAQGFVDGATFFVDVECWNELGGNVSHSVSKGDPVVVVGTIRTREWESDTGRRSRPVVRAAAVGPNLARGTAEFRRTQRTSAAAAEEAVPRHEPASEETHAADRDYSGPIEPLYVVDPDTAAVGSPLDGTLDGAPDEELDALPEPALR